MRRTRIALLAAAGALPAASASTGTALGADEGDVVVRRTEPRPLTVHHDPHGSRKLRTPAPTARPGHRAHHLASGSGDSSA